MSGENEQFKKNVYLRGYCVYSIDNFFHISTWMGPLMNLFDISTDKILQLIVNE